MALLSIIIPVYNTAKYLPRALGCLIQQSCINDLQLIIINDGSTDNSQSIIDEYAAKYSRIIQAHYKSNGGLSDARNYGLKYVTGKYLAFLDSDDWIDKDLYQQCIIFLEQNTDCDFLNFNFVEEWASRQKFTDCKFKVERSKYFIPIMAWNKVFRTSFWQEHNFRFKYGIKYEDVELIPKIIYYAKRYEFLNNYDSVLHYNRANLTSITKNQRDTTSLMVVFNSLKEFNHQVQDQDLKKFIATTLFYQLILFGGNPRQSWRVYLSNRVIFKAHNIISKLHYPVYILQKLHLDILFCPLVYLIHKLQIKP